MTQSHKGIQPAQQRSFRIAEREERDARTAANLESARLGKRIGWTTLLRDHGMAAIRRILKRAGLAA